MDLKDDINYLYPNYSFLTMHLGEYIKKIRESKGLSQKQVALACKIDTSNYSRIENGHTDPSFSSVVKIAKALGVSLGELFKTNGMPTETRSADKSLMEKVALIEHLDKKDRQAFYAVLDAFIGKHKLKEALNEVLHNVK